MQPLVDLAALDRQTFGDPALRREVVAMFQEQAPPLLAALEAAHGAARAEIAHRLKGSALALGATPLAEAAAAVEGDSADLARAQAVRALAAQTLAALTKLLDD